MALRHSKHIEMLVNTMFDISQLDNNQLILSRSYINLNTLVHAFIPTFEQYAEKKEVEFNTYLSVHKTFVFADESRLNQIIYNLISFVIDITKSKHEVSIFTVLEENRVKLIVKNNDEFLSESLRHQLFDRFSTIENNTVLSSRGTNISLIYVNEIAKLNDAELSIDNISGHNAFILTFTIDSNSLDSRFNIPVDELEELPSLAGKINAMDEVSNIHDTINVLVVEDNVEMNEFIKICLSSNDIHFHSAYDGIDGLKKINTILPDIVISDVMMPAMNGFEMISKMYENQELRGIPVLFLTAKADGESQLKGLKLGASAYITKPFGPDLLKVRFENLLNTRLQNLKSTQKQLQPPLNQNANTDLTFKDQTKLVLKEKGLHSGFTVEEMANSLFMDRSSLYRRIKYEFHTTPNALIHDFRMKHAYTLLKENKASISEIAFASGFNSISYFSQSFKKFFGKSPSQIS